MTAVVEAKLVAAPRRGRRAVPRSLLELVVGRAQGNPFYAEELLNYVHAQGIDPADERALRSLELPGEPPQPGPQPHRHAQRGAAAHAQGGERRRPRLPGAGAPGRLPGARDDRRRARAPRRRCGCSTSSAPTARTDESYLFKHAVTQEVAYESLPYALRATLHARRRAVPRASEPDAIERNLDLLAHHYWHERRRGAKKRLYLRRAGEAAQASYANAAAIDYYERLAPLLPEAERVEVLLELGKVLELVGELGAARAATETRRSSSPEARRRARARPGARPRSPRWRASRARFDEAAERLDAGRAPRSSALGEERGPRPGAPPRGDARRAARATPPRRASATSESLEIRAPARRPQDDGERAQQPRDRRRVRGRLRARALVSTSRRSSCGRELGDRWAIAVSMTNLGMIAVARGPARGGARPLRGGDAPQPRGRRQLDGRAQRTTTSATRSAASATTRRRATHYADEPARLPRATTTGGRSRFLLEDVGRARRARAASPERALELLGAADALREEIGSPRGADARAGARRRPAGGARASRRRAARAARERGDVARWRSSCGAGCSPKLVLPMDT